MRVVDRKLPSAAEFVTDLAARVQDHRIRERRRVDVDIAAGRITNRDRAETVGKFGEFHVIQVEGATAAADTDRG